MLKPCIIHGKTYSHHSFRHEAHEADIGRAEGTHMLCIDACLQTWQIQQQYLYMYTKAPSQLMHRMRLASAAHCWLDSVKQATAIVLTSKMRTPNLLLLSMSSCARFGILPLGACMLDSLWWWWRLSVSTSAMASCWAAHPCNRRAWLRLWLCAKMHVKKGFTPLITLHLS